MRKQIYKTAAVALSAVMLAGCGANSDKLKQMQGAAKGTESGTEKETTSTSTINQAQISRDELYDTLLSKRINTKSRVYYEEDAVAYSESTNDMNATAKTAESAGADHSETNNQTKGVDEGDIIKTDGKYIYYVNSADDTILISEANGNQAQFVSKIKAEADNSHSRNISGINIYEDRLIVIMNEYEEVSNDYTEDVMYDIYCRSRGMANTVCAIYDVSDRSNPKKLEEHTQDGYFNTSRLNGDVLYLVSSSYKSLKYRDDFLPKIDGQEVNPNKVAIPGSLSSNDITYTVISSIGLTDSYKVRDMVSVCGDNPVIYMSSDSLYVVNEYEEYKPIAESADSIKKYINEYIEKEFKDIEDSWERDWYEKYVLPEIKENEKEELEKYEKENFDEEFPEYKEKEKYNIVSSKIMDISGKTRISKYVISDGNLNYTGQGETEGTIENNLCLDEKDGYLRMFSCESTSIELVDYVVIYADDKEIVRGYENKEYMGEEEESNKVSVFDSNMNRVAYIENIAEKESIYAARFIGDYGYLVTFEQTDPLFTVDFSNPLNPKIIGALEMPGYSENLFSYGEDMLFGIGELDWNTKLEMYNIKGNEASILATKVLENGYADAMYDYKDVMVEYEKNIIGFSLYDWNDNVDDSKYLYKLYRYTGSSFDEIASVKLKSENDYYGGSARAVYIGDYIYICYGNNIYWLNYKNAGEEAKKISYKN